MCSPPPPAARSAGPARLARLLESQVEKSRLGVLRRHERFMKMLATSLHKVGFVDALRLLAERYGIEGTVGPPPAPERTRPPAEQAMVDAHAAAAWSESVCCERVCVLSP